MRTSPRRALLLGSCAALTIATLSLKSIDTPATALKPSRADAFSYITGNTATGVAARQVIANELRSSSNSSCGSERWPVKTGSDADAGKVNTSARTTSIASLSSYSDPGTYQQSNRSAGPERQVWKVTATLTEYKQESDSDYHLVLSDGSRRMIVEIPAPACVASSSRFYSQIRAARSAFDHRYTASSSFRHVNVTVTVTGVGMFDRPHGQTGAASNDLELHPVLSFQ